MSGAHSHYNSPPRKPTATATATAVSPPTPTTHPSSDGNSTTSHQSETAATASLHRNDAKPPKPQPPPPPQQQQQQPPRRKTPFPVRDDCWSEAATFTLIEAWGERIVKLNSGSLRQKHWSEVADAVNARHGHVKKARRSDVQCKNRIDTLKKKYKVEKALVLELGADRYVSPWPFFAPLDSLIGSSFKPSTKTPTPPPPRKRIKPPPSSSSLPALPPPPSSVPVGRRSKRPPPPATDSSFFRRNFSVMAAAAAAVDGAEDDSDTSMSSGGSRKRWRSWNRNGDVQRRVEEEEDEARGGDPYHQLADAIGRFAEVYKRVEEAKQRQMVELEKQRMQFTKDLELERMKLLMESQVQLGKLKRLKSNSEPDYDSASIS